MSEPLKPLLPPAGVSPSFSGTGSAPLYPSAPPKPSPLAPAGWLESGIALLDPGGRLVRINEEFAQWLDKPADELAGRSLWVLLAERCPDWAPALESLRTNGEAFTQAPLTVPPGEGSPPHPPQWFNIELARHLAGTFVRFASTLPPLSELAETAWDEHVRHGSAQRELFVRLLRAEAQLARLSDRWPGVIFSQRADFTFRFVSPKIEELTGAPAADWQNKSNLFWEVVHDADADALRLSLAGARQSRQPITCTYRVRHVQTGRIAYVMEHRQAIVSPGGLLLGYEGVWLDVTRQTIAEKRLTSAAWKETLSVLTTGLAHDFGNLMAGIHALTESFLDQVGPRHEFTEGLDQIKLSAQQAGKLVHRIIDLHQGRTGECYFHNLNELVLDLADLTRKFLPRRMPLAVELDPQSVPVYLDAIEFRQIVVGLVLNAIEATPPQGRITLRTSIHAQLPPRWNGQGTPPRLPAACLVVQDTGRGIPPGQLRNVSDPFFTTKPGNKGSGLGLYNARLFAEKHHGALAIDSTEGQGTTVQLWLPQADFTEADSPPAPRASTDPARAGSTVKAP